MAYHVRHDKYVANHYSCTHSNNVAVTHEELGLIMFHSLGISSWLLTQSFTSEKSWLQHFVFFKSHKFFHNSILYWSYSIYWFNCYQQWPKRPYMIITKLIPNIRTNFKLNVIIKPSTIVTNIIPTNACNSYMKSSQLLYRKSDKAIFITAITTLT